MNFHYSIVEQRSYARLLNRAVHRRGIFTGVDVPGKKTHHRCRGFYQSRVLAHPAEFLEALAFEDFTYVNVAMRVGPDAVDCKELARLLRRESTPS